MGEARKRSAAAVQEALTALGVEALGGPRAGALEPT